MEYSKLSNKQLVKILLPHLKKAVDDVLNRRVMVGNLEKFYGQPARFDWIEDDPFLSRVIVKDLFSNSYQVWIRVVFETGKYVGAKLLQEIVDGKPSEKIELIKEVDHSSEVYQAIVSPEGKILKEIRD